MNKIILAQARELEVTYPKIFGIEPKTVAFGLVEYTAYIFNFAIAVVGLIAFAVLVWAGIRYLTSVGKPEETKTARKQIKSAIGGIIILLLSYLILTTINPRLIILDLPLLRAVPPVSITHPTVPPPLIHDIFARIRSLAEAAKSTASLIDNTASTIKSLTDSCNCSRTQPLCLVRNYRGGACRAEYCYAAALEQPCSNIRDISANRQRIVDLRDLILYYKNRARAEAEDLKDEVERIIDEKIRFLDKRVLTETEKLGLCETNICRELQQKIIDSLRADIKKLQEEKNLKQNLGTKLIELANVVEKINTPATEIAALPDQCLTNVKTQCRGSCSGGGHDTKGCFPGSCSGGNPCPTGEIQRALNEINSVSRQIQQKAEEIGQILK
jgi:hypothetical protein